MMMLKIPTPRPALTERKIIPPIIGKQSKLLFSYELLETDHEYYNLSSVCDKGVQHWVECLKQASNIEASRFLAGCYTKGTLRFHPNKRDEKHDWPRFLKDRDDLEEAFFQIRFGKTKGGVHGVLIDNIFYIIWFDPRHLYYHDPKFGPKKKLEKPGACCIDRDNITEKLQDELQKCKQTIREYETMLEELTDPQKP